MRHPEKTNAKNFNDACYELLKKIPKGKVTTYREMARALNNSKASRAVGNAMAQNKQLIKIPCHRVIRSDGDIGSYALGKAKKSELLIKEGVAIQNGKIEDMEKVMYYFDN